jgi:hypothetical protein
VDGHPFTLSNRPAMSFIYDMIPMTAAEAFGRTDVIMKCTQVGFTVMEMLAMIYLAVRFAPAKIGMFLPVRDLAAGKSSDRFMPIVRTVPAVHKLMLQGEAGLKKGEGNVLTRNLGASIFHFLWTSGKASTDPTPWTWCHLMRCRRWRSRTWKKPASVCQHRPSATRSWAQCHKTS